MTRPNRSASPPRVVRATALAIAVALLPACDTTTTPDPNFDPGSHAASLDSVVVALEGLDGVLQSFALANGALTQEGGDIVEPATVGPETVARTAAAYPLGDRLAERLTLLAVIPERHLGATFAWDAERGRYARDDQRDGAPADGVRFLLYEISPQTRRPADPADEIGYIDVIDETSGSGATARVRVRAVERQAATAEETVRVDYTIQLEHEQTGSRQDFDQTAEGHLVDDDGGRIDFTVRRTLVLDEEQETIELDGDYRFERRDRGVEVVQTTEGLLRFGDGFTVELDVVMAVTHPANEITLTVAIAPNGAVEGGMRVGDRDVMRIGGNGNDPEFTRPDGTEPTLDERSALRRLFTGLQIVGNTAERILNPFQPLADPQG